MHAVHTEVVAGRTFQILARTEDSRLVVAEVGADGQLVSQLAGVVTFRTAFRQLSRLTAKAMADAVDLANRRAFAELAAWQVAMTACEEES